MHAFLHLRQGLRTWRGAIVSTLSRYRKPSTMKLENPTVHRVAGPLELVCPAGSLPALKAAVDNGADTVYLGFRDATNARNFAGLNFDEKAIAEGVRYAHQHGRKVLLALNTYPQPHNWTVWRSAIDRAADAGLDAIIVADPGLMAYARQHHPQLRLHLSSLGAPILHDAFYPEALPIKEDDFLNPLKLLARAIAFDDPLSGERRRFDSARTL